MLIFSPQLSLCRGVISLAHDLQQINMGHSWLFCLLWCRARMCGKQKCQCSKHRNCPAALCITLVFAQWWAFEAASCPRHKALNEDNTLNLHITPPLRKHFVVHSSLYRLLNKYILIGIAIHTKTTSNRLLSPSKILYFIITLSRSG